MVPCTKSAWRDGPLGKTPTHTLHGQAPPCQGARQGAKVPRCQGGMLGAKCCGCLFRSPIRIILGLSVHVYTVRACKDRNTRTLRAELFLPGRPCSGQPKHLLSVGCRSLGHCHGVLHSWDNTQGAHLHAHAHAHAHTHVYSFVTIWRACVQEATCRRVCSRNAVRPSMHVCVCVCARTLALGEPYHAP